MTCDQLREYYEEFALGVLEGAERDEIVAHLERNCPACTSGVADARSLVSQFAYAAPEREAPRQLKRAILAAIQPARLEMPRRRNWMPPLAWTAAAAMLLFALLTSQQVRELRLQNADLEVRSNELASRLAEYQRAFAITGSSESRTVSLVSAQPQQPQIRAFWNESLGLVLLARGMPVPANNRTYQIWVVPKEGRPVSAGTFRPDVGGEVMTVSAPQATIADAAALAITDEPAGGSPQPTTTPRWVGPLG